MLRVLYEGLAWPLPVATAVAAEVLILVNSSRPTGWSSAMPSPALDRLMRYHGASAGALVVYWLVINGLAEFLGLPYVVAFMRGHGGRVRLEPGDEFSLGLGEAIAR